MSGRVLITGGAGFIGTHLAERLVADREVVLFDNFRRDSLPWVRHLRDNPKVTVVAGDVLDPTAVGKALDGVDTVLHLAAIAGVSSYYKEPWRTLEVNILGTVNLLRQIERHRIRRFVHFSTSEVFGPDALFVDEEAGFRIGPVSDKRWVYSTSKLAGEQLVLRHAEEHAYEATIVRPFNIYGPRQTGEGAISNFCRAALRKEPMAVYGDGTALRAWCFVSDMVDAIDAALATPGAAGEAFNIGNPREIETTLGLARRIGALSGGAAIEFREVKRQEVRARVPVIDKARRVLRWEPRVDLDTGLRATLEFFRQEGTP